MPDEYIAIMSFVVERTVNGGLPTHFAFTAWNIRVKEDERMHSPGMAQQITTA